jgi:hypothetical protein
MYPKQEDLVKFYGNPTGGDAELSPKWEIENIVTVPCPWDVFAAWAPKLKIRLRMHKKCAADLQLILNELWELHGKDYFKIQKSGLHLCGGTFNYRLIRGRSILSTHAFGAAIDFDPSRNGLGNMTPHMPKEVVKVFEDHGWVWGGRWKKRPDGMHFQACQ